MFQKYSGLISNLCDRAKATVKAMDPTNEMDYLRVTGKKHEILVAPDEDYILIVIQNQTEA
jgi:dynein light chain roadblock-type